MCGFRALNPYMRSKPKKVKQGKSRRFRGIFKVKSWEKDKKIYDALIMPKQVEANRDCVKQPQENNFKRFKAKSRKYQGVFEVKSRVKTWQVRGIWSQQLEH